MSKYGGYYSYVDITLCMRFTNLSKAHKLIAKCYVSIAWPSLEGAP